MLYKIDKSNVKLALKEIEVVAGLPKLVIEGYYQAKDTNKELGMTKAKYQEIKHWPKGSFKIISHTKESEKKIMETLWEKSSKKVDLKNPNNELHIFEKGIFKKVWERNELQDRRSHLLASNHPTTTNPKIARAMINIANQKLIFDPFCGAGGILLEAKLMKKRIQGIDIDKIQIKRAKNNIGKASLKVADSLEEEWPGFIVTDLPYGRNSKIQKDFYKKFWKKVSHGVIGLPSNEKYPKAKFETTIYLHKSLSKKIILI